MGLRFQEELTMAEITPAFIESRLPHLRWCAYKGVMMHMDGFSADQKCARPEGRFCMEYSNAQKRARTLIKGYYLSRTDMRAYGTQLNIKIVDLPTYDSKGKEILPRRESPRHAGGAPSENVVLEATAVEEEQDEDEEDDEPLVDDDDDADADVPDEDKEAQLPPRKRKPAKKNQAKRRLKKQKSLEDAEAEAARKELVQEAIKPEVIEAMIMEYLPNLTEYDMNNTDDSTKRDYKGDLFTYDEYAGDTDMLWTIALDNVRPSARLPSPPLDCDLPLVFGCACRVLLRLHAAMRHKRTTILSRRS
jgi:hypothetical protein